MKKLSSTFTGLSSFNCCNHCIDQLYWRTVIWRLAEREEYYNIYAVTWRTFTATHSWMVGSSFSAWFIKKIPPKEQEDKRCLLSLCDTRLTIIIAKICIRRRHSVSCYSHTIVDLSFRKTVQYNLLLVRCISLHKNVDTTLKS